MSQRNILTDIDLDELSGVGVPAQEGATAAFIKSKTLIATVAGDPAVKTAPKEPAVTTIDNTADLAKANDQIAVLTKANARMTALLGLTADERAYFERLPAVEQDAHITKGTTKATAAALVAADEVVYTDGRGQTFRKSDDPRWIQMAKDNDELRKTSAAAELRADQAEFSKQAVALFKHTAGTDVVKTAVYRAVRSIGDAALRKEALELLERADMAGKYISDRQSLGGSGEPVPQSPEAQIYELATKAMKADPKAFPTFEDAQAHVVANTAEGQSLYKAMRGL